MRSLVPILATLFAIPAMAQESESSGADEVSYEETVVQCIFDAKPELLYAMRDAEDQEGFVSAFREGAELCEADEAYQYSMKLFFDAVNDRIGPPTYEDEE